jgi:hypothetical protein
MANMSVEQNEVSRNKLALYLWLSHLVEHEVALYTQAYIAARYQQSLKLITIDKTSRTGQIYGLEEPISYKNITISGTFELMDR